MMEEIRIPQEEVERTFVRLKREAESSGYHLNPDEEFTKDIIHGLLVNEKRFGYWACPCRIAAQDRSADRDIICPCDYRDADLEEYGQCYCALYVSEEIAEGRKGTHPIPERRGLAEVKTGGGKESLSNLSHPVWRCRVCGYLCAREEAPLKCPICKADKDRFERFL
jgi:ferredoxin-thioredoxin reductase catalytic subunit